MGEEISDDDNMANDPDYKLETDQLVTMICQMKKKSISNKS